jgi:hypothetical protein
MQNYSAREALPKTSHNSREVFSWEYISVIWNFINFINIFTALFQIRIFQIPIKCDSTVLDGQKEFRPIFISSWIAITQWPPCQWTSVYLGRYVKCTEIERVQYFVYQSRNNNLTQVQ